MDPKRRTDWWSLGEMCEACNSWYCSKHKPYIDNDETTKEVGPLNTTGVTSTTVGSLEIFFLEWHSNGLGNRTLVGDAVYRGKSYDGKPGDRAAAEAVASASVMWLGRLFLAQPWMRPDVLVAVPPKSERAGISLPALLAGVISSEFGIPVAVPFRWRDGTAQAKALAFEDRQFSLSSMLELVAVAPTGTVMVVDDVLQTGATISVLARQLVRLGATKVMAFAPSRAAVYPRRNSR